jgi:hypothetical protein
MMSTVQIKGSTHRFETVNQAAKCFIGARPRKRRANTPGNHPQYNRYDYRL